MEKLPQTLGEEKKAPEQSGQWLWKNLKPFGCILCLVIMAAALITMFTAGGDPIPGYEPPQDGEYYAANLPELKAELEENVFPELEGVLGCEIKGEKLSLSLEEEHFAVTRSAILRYFDSVLFEFVME